MQLMNKSAVGWWKWITYLYVISITNNINCYSDAKLDQFWWKGTCIAGNVGAISVPNDFENLKSKNLKKYCGDGWRAEFMVLEHQTAVYKVI
jgi:hypothetical protein